MSGAPGPDWEAFRAGFPALARAEVFASTAGGGPIPARAAAAGRAYFDEAAAEGVVACGQDSCS